MAEPLGTSARCPSPAYWRLLSRTAGCRLPPFHPPDRRPYVAFLPLCPVMDAERPPPLPLTTLLVINDLRPVAARLLASIEGWRSVLTEEQWSGYRERASRAAVRLERQVACNGSAVVYRGSPEVAGSLEAGLREAGLTTSLNTIVPDLRQGSR